MKKEKQNRNLSAEEHDNHYTKSDDALHAEYNEVLETIEANNDEDAKDNMSDYMDELEEESDALGNFSPPS